MTRSLPTAARSARRQALARAGLAALTWLAAAGGTAAEEPAAVRLGLVTFLSGPAAGAFGLPAANAAELIVEAINQGALPPPYDRAGMGGARVEPVLVDEAGGVAKQVAEFRNLAQRRGVDAVVGYISSGSCLGIAPVAEELKLLTVFYTCGTPRIFEEARYRYVFRTTPHSTMDGVGAARYVLERLPETRSYAGINQNYAWGQDSWRDFHLSMRALRPGAEVKTEQFPRLFAGQFNAEISALQVAGAEVAHSSLWGGDLEAFLLQAAARGLHEHTRLVLVSGEPSMFLLGDRIPDGVIIGGRGPYGVFAEATPLNAWFRERFEARYDTPPTYPAYQMAQALLGLKVAYDKAAAAAGGRPDIEAVVEALEYLEYQAFGTTIRLALGGGHQAITGTAYGVYRFDRETGRPTVVDMVRYPAECVNPPDGVPAVAWIESGFPDARCSAD